MFGYDEKMKHMVDVHQELIFLECPKKCGFQDADDEAIKQHLLQKCPNVMIEEVTGERDPEVDYEDAPEKVQKAAKIGNEESKVQEDIQNQEQQLLM